MSRPSQARIANAANIEKKLKAGKTVSKSDLAEYEEVSRLVKTETQDRNPFDIDNSGLAAFFEVSQKTICAWAKQGMPKESYGLYNLKKCFDWWQDNIAKTQEDNDPTITALRAENLRIKNERERMKRDTERDLLISRSEVLDEWCKRIGEVKQSLLGLPIALPPILEGKDTRTMRDLIRAEAIKILDGYCREGKHCSKKIPRRK